MDLKELEQELLKLYANRHAVEERIKELKAILQGIQHGYDLAKKEIDDTNDEDEKDENGGAS